MQKNRHLGTIAQLWPAVSSQLRHVSTIGKKLVKQQYLPHMSPQYGKLRPTNSWDWFGCLRHPSNFNGFRILPSLLQRHHSPEANQTLLNVWPSPVLVHYICIFGGFRLSQNSLYVQVLCSPILAALLHDTWAAGISQSASWYKKWNYATFTPHHFQQRAPPIFRGRPSCWA